MTIIQTETKDSSNSEALLTSESRPLSAEEILLLQDMAEAGILYGLNKSKTHPKMRPSILTTRSGVEIINLENTIKELEKASLRLKSVSSAGKSIIIVGTSPVVKSITRDFGLELKQPFVAERWLGGTLTNFNIIENRIKHYNKLIADRDSGALDKYTKKERLLIDKKLEKMKVFFEGIANMTRIPGAMIILDIKANLSAAREGLALGIPVIAFVNTDTNPDIVNYPIPANNRLSTSIRWMMNFLKDSMKTSVISEMPVIKNDIPVIKKEE